MRVWIPRLFFITIGIAVIGFFYFAYLQYSAWYDAGPPTQYLVPPYQKIWYLFGYIIGHYTHRYVVSLGAAFVFLGVAILLNEKYQRRFFEDEEPYLGALFIFLLGNPLWIYYLASILLILVVGSLVISRWLKKSDRFPIYYLWFPVAIGVFVVSKLLI